MKPTTRPQDASKKELLKALRAVKALSTYRNGGIENADVSDMIDDLTAINEIARAALEEAKKAKTAAPLGYLGIDQYGTKYVMNDCKHPRKWLLDHFGRKWASVMYCDAKGGQTKRVGWIIAGHWVNVYRVSPLEE